MCINLMNCYCSIMNRVFQGETSPKDSWSMNCHLILMLQ